MLTPMDIHNKEFSRSFRGYDEDEVDAFLDEVVNDYERLLRERDELRDQVARLQEEFEEARNRSARPGAVAEKPTEPEKPKAPEPKNEPPAVKKASVESDETALEIMATNVALEARIADYENQLAEYKKLDESLRSTLFLAQSHAKELTGKAEEDADRILSEAKAEAERLMVESRQQADEALGSARNEAENIITDARETARQETEETLAKAEQAKNEAEETRRASEATAEQVLTAAKEEAAKLCSEAEQKVAGYRADQENLVNSSREFLSKIRTLLAGQLAMLDQGSADVMAGVSAAVPAGEDEGGSPIDGN